MSKCSPVSVRESWFIGLNYYRVAQSYVVPLLTFVGLTIGFCVAVLLSRTVRAGAVNLVDVPGYAGWKGGAPIEERGNSEAEVQYVPITEEKPLLRKEVQQEDISGGAAYGSGEELVIEPESPEFDTSDEPIQEGGELGRPADVNAASTKAEGTATYSAVDEDERGQEGRPQGQPR